MKNVRLFAFRLLPYFLGTVAVLTLMVPALLLAQSPAPPTPPNPAELGAQLIPQLVSIVVIPFVVYLVRLGLPKIPRIAVPVVVFALASLADYLGGLVTGGTFSVLTAAAITAGAVLLREVVTTLQEHGFN